MYVYISKRPIGFKFWLLFGPLAHLVLYNTVLNRRPWPARILRMQKA